MRFGYNEFVKRIEYRVNPLTNSYEVIISVSKGFFHQMRYERFQIHDKSMQGGKKFVDLVKKHLNNDKVRLDLAERFINDDETLPKVLIYALGTITENGEIILLSDDYVFLKVEEKK